jgi:hypothetical protein
VFAVSHPIEVCPCKHAFLAVTRTPTSFLSLFLTIHCWITSAIASNADITGRTKVDVVVKTKIANAAAIIGRTRAINDFARKQELYTLPPPLSSVRSRRKIILNNNIPCNLIAEMCVLAFFSPDLTNGALNFPPPFRQRPGELQLISTLGARPMQHTAGEQEAVISTLVGHGRTELRT